jgi:hypothetical protein
LPKFNLCREGAGAFPNAAFIGHSREKLEPRNHEIVDLRRSAQEWNKAVVD